MCFWFVLNIFRFFWILRSGTHLDASGSKFPAKVTYQDLRISILDPKSSKTVIFNIFKILTFWRFNFQNIDIFENASHEFVLACPQGPFFSQKARISFWRARRGLFFLKKTRISFWRARRGLFFPQKVCIYRIWSPFGRLGTPVGSIWSAFGPRGSMWESH